jgi:transcriptional regulator with XRE-family HTH domain
LLGIQLARARLRKKLTQSELAARIGTTQAAVSRLENGKGNPSLYTFLVAARELDADLVVEYRKN